MRSFNLMQNEVEYRVSLVSKSLPVKKQFLAKCLLSVINRIINVLLYGR